MQVIYEKGVLNLSELEKLYGGFSFSVKGVSHTGYEFGLYVSVPFKGIGEEICIYKSTDEYALNRLITILLKGYSSGKEKEVVNIFEAYDNVRLVKEARKSVYREHSFK